MEGGADTTAMFLQFFVLCMLANPEVKLKAQDEIDRVIGHSRSPELEDIEDLPYIRAIINEVAPFSVLRRDMRSSPEFHRYTVTVQAHQLPYPTQRR